MVARVVPTSAAHGDALLSGREINDNPAVVALRHKIKTLTSVILEWKEEAQSAEDDFCILVRSYCTENGVRLNDEVFSAIGRAVGWDAFAEMLDPGAILRPGLS